MHLAEVAEAGDGHVEIGHGGVEAIDDFTFRDIVDPLLQGRLEGCWVVEGEVPDLESARHGYSLELTGGKINPLVGA